MNSIRPLSLALGCVLLTSCAHRPQTVSEAHLQRETGSGTAVPQSDIPAPVLRSQSLPPPRDLPPVETYNVVVNNVPAKELLFALARDAKLNVDVHPSITGVVTINALDQTLPQILDRVARQIDMRYELEDGNLSVMPDSPYLHMYKIDYLNMSRDSTSTVSIATQVSAPGSIDSSGGGGGASNSSNTEMTNVSNNRFWESLVSAVRDLLRETDKVIPTESAATPSTAPAVGGEAGQAAATAAPSPVTFREAASVIAHQETGVIAVRATSRQHARVGEFIDRLQNNAQRQVLIEATVVEVELSDGYQQGINWNVLRQGNSRFQLAQAPSGGTQLPGGAPVGASIPALGVLSHVGALGSTDISVNIRLLESFGRTKVLSSPKISVLNNQTALIKVVDNLVYFTLTTDFAPGSVGVPGTLTVTSTPSTVPVGFLMNVTPQVGDDDQITLNLRPTISRLLRFVDDPAVALTLALARGNNSQIPDVTSRIPEIQTREMESIIKVPNGQTAVLGGLMRDRSERNSDEVPGLARIPGAGELFKYRNDTGSKSELVIFLRPTIIRDASLQGDYRGMADRLPKGDFFESPSRPMGEATAVDSGGGG